MSAGGDVDGGDDVLGKNAADGGGHVHGFGFERLGMVGDFVANQGLQFVNGGECHDGYP